MINLKGSIRWKAFQHHFGQNQLLRTSSAELTASSWAAVRRRVKCRVVHHKAVMPGGGEEEALQGLSGMRLPCNLLRGRGKHLVAQHDCEDRVPPCLQRGLCWSKTTAWPWGGPPFVQGDGSGSWKCFSFRSLLEDNPCYMCACLPPFLQKYQSRTRFKAIFCKEAPCWHLHLKSVPIFFSLLLLDLTVLETPPPFPTLPRNFAKKSIAV